MLSPPHGGWIWLQDTCELTSIKAYIYQSSFSSCPLFSSLLNWVCLRIFCHLVRSPSVDNGFDEDPQVLPRLPGLVSFEADTQPSRATIIKRHLKRELLLSVFRNKDRHAGHLVLLGVGDSNGGRGGERDVDENKSKQNTTRWAWMASKSKTKKLFHLRGPIRREFSPKSPSVKKLLSVYFWRGEARRKKIHLDHLLSYKHLFFFFFRLSNVNKMTSTFSRGNWRIQQTQRNQHTEVMRVEGKWRGRKDWDGEQKKKDRVDKNDYY